MAQQPCWNDVGEGQAGSWGFHALPEGMRCSSFLCPLPPCTGVVSEEALWKVRTFNITDQWDHTSLNHWQLETPVSVETTLESELPPCPAAKRSPSQVALVAKWATWASTSTLQCPPMPLWSGITESQLKQEVWIKCRVSEHNIKIVRFSVKNHSSYQEPGRFQMNEKRQSIDPTTGMIETLKLCDKDFKATVTKSPSVSN